MIPFPPRNGIEFIEFLGLNFLGRYLNAKMQARQLPYFWTQLNISMLAH